MQDKKPSIALRAARVVGRVTRKSAKTAIIGAAGALGLCIGGGIASGPGAIVGALIGAKIADELLPGDSFIDD